MHISSVVNIIHHTLLIEGKSELFVCTCGPFYTFYYIVAMKFFESQCIEAALLMEVVGGRLHRHHLVVGLKYLRLLLI